MRITNRYRLDNLIPIRPSLSGVQTAGWAPGPPARRGLGCRILADVRIPVGGAHPEARDSQPGDTQPRDREAVTLSADVYTPAQSGRFPAVVVFGAYSTELDTAGIPVGTNEIGSPPVFTDRGYVHVVVMRRGMGRSDGETGVFFGEQDVDDLEEVIAWAAAQSWCDGDVVMFGTSYYGIVQTQVAVRRPPALKAIFANEVCTDYFRHIIRFGGTAAPNFVSLWTGSNFTDEVFGRRVPPVLRAALSQIVNSPLKSLWQPQLRKRMDDVLTGFSKRTPTLAVREQCVNWLIDGNTRASNSIPSGPWAELAKIDVPFVMVQNLGMFNLHQFGSYEVFEKASTSADRRWLILGPPEYELPVYGWQLEALAFFDHIVRGSDNGYAAQPAVRYWLDGADRFGVADSFPIPGARPVRYHLGSGGADSAVHTLTAGAGGQTGVNTWAAVPIGATVGGGFSDVVNQILTFETVMTETAELCGPVTASLKFSSNEIDSHVIARLGRVDADGGYHLLSMGSISPARRRLDHERTTASEIAIDIDVPEPLTPGEPVVLCFSLTPGPTMLRPGETLRFDIGSRTDLLKSDVSHGRIHFNMPVPPYFARNTVHYGDESWIELQRVVG